MAVAAFMISYYTELSFMINAINHMYFIKTEDKSLDCKKNRVEVSFFSKIKLITGCFPNKTLKRMIKKGYKRLFIELDLMDMIKEHKINHNHLKTEGLIKAKLEDTLDIDIDSDA